MVKIEVPEQEPIGQENEIKIDDASEGDESNENPSPNRKIKMTEEDLEQMKGMTPEQKKYVEGLLGKIDEYAGYLNVICDKVEKLQESKKDFESFLQNIKSQKSNLEK